MSHIWATAYLPDIIDVLLRSVLNKKIAADIIRSKPVQVAASGKIRISPRLLSADGSPSLLAEAARLKKLWNARISLDPVAGEHGQKEEKLLHQLLEHTGLLAASPTCKDSVGIGQAL